MRIAMPKKVSVLLTALCAELRESDPMRARLESIIQRATVMELHCEELTVDAQKMAKEVQNLHADVEVAKQDAAHARQQVGTR